LPILRDMYDRAGLFPTVSLDLVARLLTAMAGRAAMAQSYVEPAEFPPGQLETALPGAAVPACGSRRPRPVNRAGAQPRYRHRGNVCSPSQNVSR